VKILIADDDPQLRAFLEGLLSEGGNELVMAEDGTQAWKILQTPGHAPLAIIDRTMPGVEGAEICRRVRGAERPDGDYTYLILLTAKGAQEDIVEGLQSGADDYLVKPVDPQELLVRVRNGQRIVNLHAQLREAGHRLWVRSQTDPLTGVLNRGAIFSRVEKELNRSNREGRQLSLALLDFDHFKTINDTHGHLAGDAALVECVGRVGKVVRSYDSVGRFGGEEFLLLFPNTGEDESRAVCERIRRAIEEGPVMRNGVEIPVTASIGLVTGTGEDTVDDLVELADQALYRAKVKGRNRVEQVGGEARKAG
jgi:two-component system cell cycle response regulator